MNTIWTTNASNISDSEWEFFLAYLGLTRETAGPVSLLCQRGWERSLRAQVGRAGVGSRFSKLMAKWFNAPLRFRIGIVHFLDASFKAR